MGGTRRRGPGESCEQAMGHNDARSEAPLLHDGQPLSSTVQWYRPPSRAYSRRELLVDRYVNFGGACLSWPGALLLVSVSWAAGDAPLKQFGFWVCGGGMVMMFNCSALLHHRAWDWKHYRELRSLDHAGISAMIIGTYTPFMLQCGCYHILAIIGALGFIGLVMETLQLASGEKGERWRSLVLKAHCVRYILMGWAGILNLGTMLRILSSRVVLLMGVGGLVYMCGIPIFLNQGLEFRLAIWHLFVACASLVFFICNVFYLAGGPPLGMPLA